jgi:hypothetical protein
MIMTNRTIQAGSGECGVTKKQWPQRNAFTRMGNERMSHSKTQGRNFEHLQLFVS